MTSASWLYRIPSEETAVWGALPQALAAVTRTGVSTVPSFVISAAALQDLYGQPKLRKAVEAALKHYDPKHPQHLAGVAQDVRKAIRTTDLPAAFKKEVGGFLDELEHYLLLKKGSGLRLHLVWCAGNHPLHHTATVKTWKDFHKAFTDLLSLHFAVPAFHARLRERGVVMPPAAPILVQAHPEAAASGIGQLYDPASHDSHTVYLTAHHHEHVRERKSDTDTYRFDRTTLLPLSHAVGRHRWAEKRDGRHVKAAAHGTPILSEEQRLYLARLIRRAQGGFETPMCFHWVLVGGQFFIAEAYPLAEGTETKKLAVDPHAVDGPLPVAFGHPLNPGLAAGTARFVSSKTDAERLQAGDIAIVPHLKAADRALLHNARALVCEVGNATSPEAAVAVSLGVPAIGGLAHAAQFVSEGQIITVDATRGVLYEGNQPEKAIANPAYSPAHPVTATHVSLLAADPLHVSADFVNGADGIGLLRGEFLLEMAGVHPRHILERDKAQEYGEILEDVVEQAAYAAYPRHLRYQLHDVHAGTAAGRALRPDRHEPNPKLGYRGAQRLLKEPELMEVELAALHRIAMRGMRTFELVLPMVRSLKEAQALLDLTVSLWPGKAPLPRIWLRCETPALAISAESLCELPIHGIYFDVPALAQFMSGLDGHNYQVAHHVDQSDPAVLDALHYAIATCRAHGVRAALIAEDDELHAEVIAEAVRVGLTEVVVSRAEVDEVRGLLASVEQRLIVDHVLQEDLES